MRIQRRNREHSSEQQLCREARRTLAQLSAENTHFSRNICTLVKQPSIQGVPYAAIENNPVHIFECPSIPTDLTPVDLWRRPTQAADLVGEWRAALAAAEEA